MFMIIGNQWKRTVSKSLAYQWRLGFFAI